MTYQTWVLLLAFLSFCFPSLADQDVDLSSVDNCKSQIQLSANRMAASFELESVMPPPMTAWNTISGYRIAFQNYQHLVSTCSQNHPVQFGHLEASPPLAELNAYRNDASGAIVHIPHNSEYTPEGYSPYPFGSYSARSAGFIGPFSPFPGPWGPLVVEAPSDTEAGVAHLPSQVYGMNPWGLNSQLGLGRAGSILDSTSVTEDGGLIRPSEGTR